MVTTNSAYGAIAGNATGDVEAPPPISRVESSRKRMKELAIYDPYDWKATILGMTGTIYMSRAFFVIGTIGTLLIILTRIEGIGLTTDRVCRGWCSHFALGSQAHQYMGIVLFLLMAFRNNQAYQMYQSGLRAHFAMKAALRGFVEAVLFRVPAETMTPQQRSRVVAFAIAFPYAVTLDLRDEGVFDDADETLENLLGKDDLADLQAAPTMPIYVLESLTAMIYEYCEPTVPRNAITLMYNKIDSLMGPYGECERIKQNPCAFAYVAHMRVLLIAYLITLPLALVEQMGYATVPVYWVVCYALMSLEMLAVDVENPFGYGASDLRLNVQNMLIKESILESWNRWEGNLGQKAASEKHVQCYTVSKMK